MKPYTLITLQFILAILLIFVFPIYFVMAAENVVPVEIIKFTPQVVTINNGSSVRLDSKEKHQYHSILFEKLSEPETDYLFAEDSYERKFDKPGDFLYLCSLHPEMTGVIYGK